MLPTFWGAFSKIFRETDFEYKPQKLLKKEML